MRCKSTFYRSAQLRRRGCSILPERLLNLSGHGAQSHAEYSQINLDMYESEESVRVTN